MLFNERLKEFAQKNRMKGKGPVTAQKKRPG